jgi:hypothetical protein
MLGMSSLLSPPSYSELFHSVFARQESKHKKALGYHGSKASTVDDPIENP